MSAKFRVKKVNGLMSSTDRAEFSRQWQALDDGEYEILFKKATRGNTRYKFYFDAVMACILHQAGSYFVLGSRPAATVEEIHLVMKYKYNPMEIVDLETGEMIRVPCSTTVMNDTDFIQRYEQQIIADFSGPPFFVDFPTFEQWVERRKSGTWDPERRPDPPGVLPDSHRM